MQTMNKALYKKTACNIEKNDTLSLKNWKPDFMSLYTTCICKLNEDYEQSDMEENCMQYSETAYSIHQMQMQFE
jgi:hypothetical protein